MNNLRLHNQHKIVRPTKPLDWKCIELVYVLARRPTAIKSYLKGVNCEPTGK